MAREETMMHADLPRAYVFMLRFGPWAISLFGFTLVLAGLFSQRPAAIVALLLIMGTGCVVLGIVLPRTSGPLSLGRDGVEVGIQPLRDLDVSAFPSGTIAAVVTDVAEKTIPDTDPNKDRLVQGFVSHALQVWTGTGNLAGLWWQAIPAHGDEPYKLDAIDLHPRGEDLSGDLSRVIPTIQSSRRWEFVGKVRGSLIFGMFFTKTPDVNALSYGTIQLHRINEAGTIWEGFYVRLEIDASGGSWLERLEPIPMSWSRERPPE